MISRRPNRRASNENAPGPTPRMVMSIVSTKMSKTRESRGFGEQVGSSESPMPTVPAVTIAVTTGVIHPITSSVPAIKADKPMNQAGVVLFGSLM